jgi:predicted Zn finger-like uncharacterized protein
MTLTISCPNCSSRYLLPEHLLGPAGARVCCPACWHRFTVNATGSIVSLEVEPLYPAASPGAGVDGGAPGAAFAAGTGEASAAGSGPGIAGAPGASAAPVNGLGATPAVSDRRAEAALRLAHEALSDLDPFVPDLLQAVVRGRLFAEFGPRVLDAFDRYRRAVAPETGASPFRRAMRERWNADLPLADAAPAAPDRT